MAVLAVAIGGAWLFPLVTGDGPPPAPPPAPRSVPPPVPEPVAAAPAPRALAPAPVEVAPAPVEVAPAAVAAAAAPMGPRTRPTVPRTSRRPPVAAPPDRAGELPMAPPAAVASPSPAAAPPSDRPTEIELLRAARRNIATSPARALDIVGEHQERFPRGALAQEREALAVEALVRVGRRAEARRRAERFLQRHPDSVHRSRIETILSN